MIFLSSLWSKIQGWVLAAGAFLAILAGAYLKGQSDQKSKSTAKVNEKRLDDIKTKKEISEDVKKMPDTDLDRSLDRFMRD